MDLPIPMPLEIGLETGMETGVETGVGTGVSHSPSLEYSFTVPETIFGNPSPQPGDDSFLTPNESRNSLTFRDRLEVIRLANAKTFSSRGLARHFKCSKTQILSTLKNQTKYIELAQNPGTANRKRMKGTSRFAAVNARVEQWADEAREQGITVTGTLLQSKAREIAQELGFQNFQASNGWLDSFRNRTRGLPARPRNPPKQSTLPLPLPLVGGTDSSYNSNPNLNMNPETLLASYDGDSNSNSGRNYVHPDEVVLTEIKQELPESDFSEPSELVDGLPEIDLEHVISLRQAVRHLEDLKTLAVALDNHSMFQSFSDHETAFKDLIAAQVRKRNSETQFQWSRQNQSPY